MMTAKIRTGVPYKPEEMAKIYEEGAIVDLSRINFPTCTSIEENMHALFVYLRNTGYEVTFDFTEMSYEQKVALIKEYLNTDIDYNIPVLNTTWLSILYACLGERIKGMESILNDLELISVQSAEFRYIERIWTFIVSLPLFLIKRLDLDTFDSKAEKTEEDFKLVNFYHVLECPEIDDLINKGAGDIPPKDYEKVFTIENTRLFECLSGCSFTTFIQGMVNSEDVEFQKFIKELYSSNTSITESK